MTLDYLKKENKTPISSLNKENVNVSNIKSDNK